MSIFSRFKVAQLLYAGFGALVLMYLFSSITSAHMMGRMNANLDRILNDNYAQIAAANELNSSVFRVSLSARKIILLNGEAEVGAEKAVYDAEIAKYDKLQASIIESARAVSDEKTWSAVNAAYKNAHALLEKFYAEVLGHKDSEAVKTLKLVANAVDLWQKELSNAIALQEQANRHAFDDSRSIYKTALIELVLIAAVSIVLACVLSFAIVKTLSDQLGGEPREAARVAERIGAGDLTEPIALKSNDRTSLMAVMHRMQANLIDVVDSVRAGSRSVALASSEIAQGNNDMSFRTEEQASVLEQTASSMHELGSTVSRNARSAAEANQLAESASAVAARGGEVVTKVVGNMKSIHEASRKISDIISVIDGIAFQTNILALNAAVEAARAGEQGRGFAVVASEVRSLAGRSANAAKEIKALIAASVERVEAGTSLVDAAGETMSEVVKSIGLVTDIVAQISAASNEQALGVTQVGTSVSAMDQATQQNAAMVEQMASAAIGLQNQAGELVEVVKRFKIPATT